jgi:hypothetical protein
LMRRFGESSQPAVGATLSWAIARKQFAFIRGMCTRPCNGRAFLPRPTRHGLSHDDCQATQDLCFQSSVYLATKPGAGQNQSLRDPASEALATFFGRPGGSHFGVPECSGC